MLLILILMKTYIYEIKYFDPVDEKYETRQIHIRKRDFSKAQLAMLRQLDTMRLQHKQIMMVELINILNDELGKEINHED